MKGIYDQLVLVEEALLYPPAPTTGRKEGNLSSTNLLRLDPEFSFEEVGSTLKGSDLVFQSLDSGQEEVFMSGDDLANGRLEGKKGREGEKAKVSSTVSRRTSCRLPFAKDERSPTFQRSSESPRIEKREGSFAILEGR